MIDSEHAEPSAFERVSPELALVDPELAAWARERLPSPGHVRADVARRRLAAGLDASRTFAARDKRADRRRAGVLIGVAGGLAVALLLADVRVEVGTTGASAERPRSEAGTSVPQALETAPTPSRSASTPPAPRPLPTAPRSRRLAWAPVQGAQSYHVELYHLSARIFAAETRHPAIVVPARWRLDGVERSLLPGELRWYVWPVVAGQRASQATVQATLRIPSS